jgi:hypothetical protein
MSNHALPQSMTTPDDTPAMEEDTTTPDDTPAMKEDTQKMGGKRKAEEPVWITDTRHDGFTEKIGRTTRSE